MLDCLNISYPFAPDKSKKACSGMGRKGIHSTGIVTHKQCGDSFIKM
jgi:hypothetical protein